MKIACVVDTRKLSVNFTADGQHELTLSDGRTISMKRLGRQLSILEFLHGGDEAPFPFPELLEHISRVEAEEGLGAELQGVSSVVHVRDSFSVVPHRQSASVTYLADSWEAFCLGRRSFLASLKEGQTSGS